jgi:hypothetical protein
MIITFAEKTVEKKDKFEILLETLLNKLKSNDKESKKGEKKVFGNKVDGSFAVIVDDKFFTELLLKKAVENGLTIPPRGGVDIGDTLIFGVNKQYDVLPVYTGKDHSQIVRLFEEGIEPVYKVSKLEDRIKIKEALEKMGKRKKELLEKKAKKLLNGELPLLPTYATLIAEELGVELIANKRHKKLLKQQEEESTTTRVVGKRLLGEFDTSEGALTIHNHANGDHVLVSQNFIKVGYKFIPIKDNNSVYISV